jgi:hypothetical protein
MGAGVGALHLDAVEVYLIAAAEAVVMLLL